MSNARVSTTDLVIDVCPVPVVYNTFGTDANSESTVFGMTLFCADHPGQ